MPETTTPLTDTYSKLIEITLDETTIVRVDPKIDHERKVAIYDILDSNSFVVDGQEYKGPYRLHLSLRDDRLIMDVRREDEKPEFLHHLPLTPFKRILKDYFLVLDSYYKAVGAAQPARIEAIDMGRRGLHDDGSRILMERLAGKITVDFNTARRLFTLLSALHWRG